MTYLLKLKIVKNSYLDRKAFSLLEVLIALSIATLLWGSTGFFIMSVQAKLRRVMRSHKMQTLQTVNLQFQSDIHSAVKITDLTPDRLSLELPEGDVIYEYSHGFLYREFKGIKVNSLENILSSTWECLSEKKSEDKNLEKCRVVLWKYKTEEKNEAIYAVKQIS